VIAAPESVSVVRCADPFLLARACYHLGNRHVPLQIMPGELRYHHDHVLDDMLRQFGLEVTYASLPFEPEAGAYASDAHSHSLSRSFTLRIHHAQVFTAVTAGFSVPALAHPGHGADSFQAGFFHPLTGLDHLLMLTGAGVLGLSGRKLCCRLPPSG
jgi:hypothetical protein